jgi:hypothetical protein
MSRLFKTGLVGTMVVLMLIDTATACRLFGRRRCQPCPSYCVPCPPPPSCSGGAAVGTPSQPDMTGEGAAGDAGGAARPTTPPDAPPMPKPADPPPAPPKVEDVLDPEDKPAEEKPAEEKPAEEKPAEEKPADPAPVEEEKPADPAPAEEKPAEEAPAEEKPADPAPAEENPAEEPKATEEPAAPAEEEMKKEDAAGLEPMDEPAAEETKTEEPAVEEPKTEEPAAEEPKTEEPKKPAKGTDDLFGPPKVSKLPVPVAATPARVQDDGSIQFDGDDRDWLDNTGRHGCRGRLVLILDGKVRILKDNGKTSTVAMRRLSFADVEYVNTQARNARAVVITASTAQ